MSSDYKRNKYEQILDVLEAVQMGWEVPTRIMGITNLNWQMTTAHLQILLKNKFIRVEIQGRRKRYSITKEGRKWLVEALKLWGDIHAERQRMGIPAVSH